MSNIKFHYLYRDASNYKKWAEVVFSNDGSLSIDAVTGALRNGFSGGTLFIAHQVRVPEVFLFAECHLTPDDHCFHEFDSVEVTSDVPNDAYSRSIREFVTEVETEARRGWFAFDPQDLSVLCQFRTAESRECSPGKQLLTTYPPTIGE